MQDKTVDEIFEMVDYLPIDIKASLATKLLESMNPTSKEIEEAWNQEIARRVKSIEDGTATFFDGEEVFAELRELIEQ